MPETKAFQTSAVSFMDESFDNKKLSAYHLSIITGEKDFAFAVLDTSTALADQPVKNISGKAGKYIALHVAPLLKEENIISSIEKLGVSSFRSVTCAVAHNKFTLIPEPLFDEENKESLLSFNHTIAKEEVVYSNILHSIGAKNIFTVPKNLESLIRKHFINANFIHNSTSFIEGLLVQYKNNSGKKVFANFHAAYFEVVILEGRNLLFCNAFTYRTPEDIAYYILFVYEQMRLNTEETELVISGDIKKSSSRHSMLYNYIQHIKFALRPDGFQYSYKFEEIPSHNFLSLLNQYLVTN